MRVLYHVETISHLTFVMISTSCFMSSRYTGVYTGTLQFIYLQIFT